MGSFQENIQYFKQEIENGYITDAYKELMDYIMDLRVYFKNKYPAFYVSGIYQGYMDMTYFSFSPESLKSNKLKIAIVFLYDKFRFEVWLAGYNKNVQNKYWELFKENDWNKYNIPSTTKGADSIMEYILVENPDCSDLDNLTHQIETSTFDFINDVLEFI